MALKYDYHIPAEQKPERVTDCAIRNVYIDFVRKTSDNLMLKGTIFDLSPSNMLVEVPEDCGLFIEGPIDVVVENVDTRRWSTIIR